MNKKIKIIDVFLKISKGEEIPERILFKGIEFIWKNNHYMSKDNKTNITIDIMNDINLEVEILEGNTEEIEELPIELLDEKDLTSHIIKHFNKINELVKAVNQIRKDLNKC